MKRIVTLSLLILTGAAVFTGCGGKTEPGKIYMPDMAYSRSYETYAERDSALFTSDPNRKGGGKIYYNNSPVEGTIQYIKTGELPPYTLPNDSNGYKMSAEVVNPVQNLNPDELKEAQRLYNINCAICHGEKAAGNGPIATSGKIGGIANLTLDSYVKMTDGTMFHSITYGKNLMGSYASQLDAHKRWMIIKYIRTLQPTAAPVAAVASKDSTGKNK